MKYVMHADGIHRPSKRVVHRDEEFEQSSFETLFAMQEKHFWYKGRHRFLLEAYDRSVTESVSPQSVVDLGGGVGGWLRFLLKHRAPKLDEVAHADSSDVALKMARGSMPDRIDCYQVDLLSLGWEEQWDAAFLLDVIEHLPNDLAAMQQISRALKPRGKVFVTAPAFEFFWSYNDDLVNHLRRYDRRSMSLLAQKAGLEVCDVRYFMFFLSPLYYLSRLAQRKPDRLSENEKAELLQKTHKIPWPPVNWCLATLTSAETPLGHLIRFPWGTSILGVFQKP